MRKLRTDETACNNCGKVFRGLATNADPATNPLCKTCTIDELNRIDAGEVTYPYGHAGDVHHRVGQGLCNCGRKCHTFGRGDDSKLLHHITRESTKPQTRLFLVTRSVTFQAVIEARNRADAKDQSAAMTPTPENGILISKVTVRSVK